VEKRQNYPLLLGINMLNGDLFSLAYKKFFSRYFPSFFTSLYMAIPSV